MHATLTTMPDLTDRKARFAELLAAHQGLLRKIAWSFSRCPADRADLLQDMAAQLWSVFPRWDERRAFSTWAYRVALNVALAGARRSPMPQTEADSLDLHDSADPALASPADGPEQHAQMDQLQRLIRALDPLNRALLLLYLDDLGYRQIGDILGLSESNVGVRISRLKQRLRTYLETPP